MAKESRTHKTLLNVKVNFIFYFITLIVSFFSRKIFLEGLGDDFIGLTGTLGNILGLLNLAELGIGAAISFTLYKPLFEQNKDKMNEVISVFGYLYRNIGYFILLTAILISIFLPKIFNDSTLPLSIIYFSFYSFLASSLIGYFINYRQILLSADQKNYVVTGYYQSSLLIKNIVQLAICAYSKNYYIWVIIELSFGIIYSFILNWKINQVYPWLKSDTKSGKILLKKYPEIVTKAKQVFIQRIAYTVLTQTTQPIIYAFSSLQMVAYYGNYMLVIDRIAALLNMTMSGVGAGVGNLIAEGNMQNIQKVFWELRAFRYWGSFVIVFAFFYLVEPFITLWLGADYILDRSIFIIILINIFIGQTRIVIMNFLNGYGLFQDVWSSIAEAIINISCAIILGSIFGIAGVLLGTTISLFLIICLWKPYFLYKYGFKMSVIEFWLKTSVFFILSGGLWGLIHILLPYITISPYESFIHWIIYALIIVTPYSIISWLLYAIFTKGMKDISIRFWNIITKR